MNEDLKSILFDLQVAYSKLKSRGDKRIIKRVIERIQRMIGEYKLQ